MDEKNDKIDPSRAVSGTPEVTGQEEGRQAEKPKRPFLLSEERLEYYKNKIAKAKAAKKKSQAELKEKLKATTPKRVSLLATDDPVGAGYDPAILGEAIGIVAQINPESVGRLTKVRVPNLYPAQARTKNGSKRFNVVNNGRRSGKTFLGIHLVCEQIKMGKKVGWFAPTYKLATEAWREIIDVIRPAVLKYNNTEMRAEVQGGGVIEIWTLENDNAGRGRKYSMVIIDEAAAAPRLKQAWEAAILPTLTDLKGTAWFFSTPAGMNYFNDLAVFAQRPENAQEWTYWHFPTSINPFIDRDEIELMKKQLPELTFRQEYLAEFIQNDGTVFRNIDACMKARYTKPDDHVGHLVVGGVDWGRSLDFTAISLYCCKCRQEVILDRFNKVSWEFQRGRLLSLCEKWGAKYLYVELNSIGAPLLDRLIMEAPDTLTFHGFTTTNKTKRRIIEGLGLSLERETSSWLNDETGRMELLAYESKISETGILKYSAPEGKHDDCLRKGTLIKTSTGYKPIEDIETGELVLTHKGRYRKVEANIVKPFQGVFYRMKATGQAPLDLSYNHPVYAAHRSYKGDITGEFDNRKWVLPGNWKKTYRAVGVFPAREFEPFTLKEEDYYINSPHSTSIKVNTILASEGLAALIGRFVADGHCKKAGTYSLELAFADEESAQADRHEQYLQSLGVAVRRVPMWGGAKGFSLVFSSKLLYHVLKETYSEDGSRKLPSFVERFGPYNKSLIDEWLSADGWYRANKDQYIGATTSPRLALEMRDLAMSVGYYASIQWGIRRHRYSKETKSQYWVSILKRESPTVRNRKISGFERGQTVDMAPYDFEGDVYNLQVEEDRSFVANGYVVHNCVIARALAWEAARLRMPVDHGIDKEIQDQLPEEWRDKYINSLNNLFIRDGYMSARREEYEEIKKAAELKRRPETYYSGENGLGGEFGNWDDLK